MPKRKFVITIEVEVGEMDEEQRNELKHKLTKKVTKLEKFIRNNANGAIDSEIIVREAVWVTDEKENTKEHASGGEKPCDCPVCTLGRLLKGKFQGATSIFSKEGPFREVLDEMTKKMTGKSFDETTHLEAAERLVQQYESFKKDMEEGKETEEPVSSLIIRISKSIDLIRALYKHTQLHTPKEGEEEKHGDELLKINQIGQRLEEVFKYFMAKQSEK